MSPTTSTTECIDLEKVLSEKFPGKKFPRFVISFLNRFLKVEYMNGLISRGYTGVEFCKEAVKYLGVTVNVEGLDNIPCDGTLYTFASNHPLGGIDGVALAGIIGERFGSVTMMVNDFLMALPGLRPLCVPINKVGGQARNLPKMVDESFGSDKQVLVFPAGKCSRMIDGKIQDIPWNKTFVTKSVQFKRAVVPVHFIGRNSRRFYKIDRIRKALGIKFNVAMAFLPDEMYRARGKQFKVVFGKPIPYESFDSEKKAAEWASSLRSAVYQLQG